MKTRTLLLAMCSAVGFLAASATADTLWDTSSRQFGSSTRTAPAVVPVAHFTNTNPYPVHLTHVAFWGFVSAGFPGSDFKFFRANAAGAVQGATYVAQFDPMAISLLGVDVDWTIAAGEEFFIGAINQTSRVVFWWADDSQPFHVQNGITGMGLGGFSNFDNPTVTPGLSTVEACWQLQGELVLPPLMGGGFETGTGTPGTLQSGSQAMDHWTVTRGSVDWVGGNYWQTPEGSRSVDLQGLNSSGGVQQAARTVAGRRYRLTFALAGNPDGGSAVKHMRASAGGAAADYEFDTTGKTRTAMGWVEHSLVFVATGTQTDIELYSTDAAGSFGAVIDNVRLVEAPCASDVAGFGTSPGGDGQLTVDDIVFFLTRFFANDRDVCDLVSSGGAVGSDGQVTVDDLVAFLSGFFGGCP